jgi:hypothetical protein
MIKKSAHRKKGGFKTAGFGDSKKKKQTKLALIVLTIIIITLILGQTVRFINGLFQPLTESISFTQSLPWDGKTTLHLVIKSNDVSVLSFDPQDKNLSLVNIPADIYVEVPGGYGKWQVRAIYEVGQAEKQPIGAKLLTDSMSTLLGLPMNGIIELKIEQTPQEFLKSLRQSPFAFLSYLNAVNSSLTSVELINFATQVSRLRADKINHLDLSNFNLLTPKILSDGSKVLIAEPQLLDNFIIDKLSESRLREEQIPVAVFNGTQSPGVAFKVARMITNMGGNVIISMNAPFIDSSKAQELEKSFIMTTSASDSETFERLKMLFNLDCSDNPNCDKIYTDKIASRAQINVVVGRDFVSR